MHLASVRRDGRERPVVVDPARGVVAAVDLGVDVHDVMDLLEDSARCDDLLKRATSASTSLFVAPGEVTFTAPYRRPHKIWGIGLNYRDHAADLSEEAPDQPASFIKADHTICGPDEPIVLPRQSARVTVEAELGLVIGRRCRDVSEEAALDYLWGVTTILDQTAEDILRLNPRFLTRAKNFPTFFCFGPELIPVAEVLATFGRIDDVEVSTFVNGADSRTNVVGNMTHSPASLIAFHSQMMPLYPGDIISSGTPGAIVVAAGDVVECRIPGVGHLVNRVVAGS